MNIDKTFSNLASGIPLERPRRIRPTAYIKGKPAECRCNKEIYSVATDSSNKPYMVMAAFILDEGTTEYDPDIRFGISRCHPKDRFNLKKGMKLAKEHAFNSSTFSGEKDCWLSKKYLTDYVNFTRFCKDSYDYGRRAGEEVRDFLFIRTLRAPSGFCKCKKVICRNEERYICYKCGKTIPFSKYKYRYCEVKNGIRSWFNERI